MMAGKHPGKRSACVRSETPRETFALLAMQSPGNARETPGNSRAGPTGNGSPP